MKTTKYFEHRRLLADRAAIKNEWIEDVIKNPIKTAVQLDGRIRKWAPEKKQEVVYFALFC